MKAAIEALQNRKRNLEIDIADRERLMAEERERILKAERQLHDDRKSLSEVTHALSVLHEDKAAKPTTE